MRAGSPFTQQVLFEDGLPDGDITFALLDGRGQPVTNGTVTPEVGSASTVIMIGGGHNTLAAGVLLGSRELSWSYTVGGALRANRHRYRVEAFLPLGVSEAGVRAKVGLEPHELEDEAIDLVAAYARFRGDVGLQNLTDVEAEDGHRAMLARDAVEAMAALTLLPALQIKLATKQSSGTDQFQRANIKWDAVRDQLESYVAQGYDAVDPNAAPTASYPPLISVVVRTDPVTG